VWPEEFADQLLAATVGVHVGGVEEVDAFIQRRFYYCARVIFVDPAAEVVSADADDRDLERCDLTFLQSNLY